MSEKQFISWKQYIQDIGLLGDTLDRVGFNNVQIVGLSRGGLIPASILSYRFNTRPIILDVRSYDGEDQSNVIINVNNFPLLANYKRLLIVDDLIDSGHTLKETIKLIQGAYPETKIHTAVVYSKDVKRNIEANFYVRNLPDRWLVFPYDN